MPSWTVADLLLDQERAVLAYADCLVYAGGRVPDGVFDGAEGLPDDEQILEFTYITCLYDMHAVMSRALRLEFDDRPDPIVEVAAPEGEAAHDFTRDLFAASQRQSGGADPPDTATGMGPDTPRRCCAT